MKMKIKAGAIQYVLVISVIIIIVLFAFISLVFLQNRVQAKSQLYKEAVHATYAAFDYLRQEKISYNQARKVVFTEYKDEETTILKKPWGLYDLVIVQSRIKNEFFEKIGIMGNHHSDRKALYLKEKNQPLILVGRTKIIGDAALPRLGVKTGSIAGTSFYGGELIYGVKSSSTGTLPSIQNLQTVRQFLEGRAQEEAKYIDLEEGANITVDFKEEVHFFETNLTISLDQMSLRGNIIISSKNKIYVPATANLEDVILKAPRIEFERGFKGTCQAFASQSILVKSNAQLNYPSSLVILEESNSVSSNELKGIILEKGADVKGVVLYQSTNHSRIENIPHIVVEKNAKVTGDVYCSKNLELGGSIHGFVYTSGFIARQFGGVYLNHIYNGIINSKEIPEEYNGLFIGNYQPKVSKWIQ